MENVIQATLSRIDDEDRATRAFRASRVQELVDVGMPKRLYPSDSAATWEVSFAFQDALTCYVNGTFIGCILAAQACLEHLLGGHMRASQGKFLKGVTMHSLLDRARRENLITEDEYNVFDRLSKRRNAYTHYRVPPDSGGLAERAVQTDESMMRVMADDAREGMLGLATICRRPPFAEPAS
jgi:hypothetical protein